MASSWPAGSPAGTMRTSTGRATPTICGGSAIPFEARIVRVADAFDAMTHRRPYHEPRSLEHGVEELRRWAGRQFDPGLVDLLVDILEEDAALARAVVSS